MSPYLPCLDNEISLLNGQLRFFPSLLGSDADALFEWFLENLSWQSDSITLYGRLIRIPRLHCWYADNDLAYHYSGLQLRPAPWDEKLLHLKTCLEGVTGATFDSVLANLYRNGSDSVGWHCDNEPELGADPVIASISFGATRRFQLRNKLDKNQKIELALPHGSMLLMGRGVQTHWQHQLPKTGRNVSARINLSYRFINASS